MFDFVRLPNPIERLEFDWVRSVFCSVLFDWIGRAKTNTIIRKTALFLRKNRKLDAKKRKTWNPQRTTKPKKPPKRWPKPKPENPNSPSPRKLMIKNLFVLASSQTVPGPLSSFDTPARWQPVTQSARSRRSYGKIGDCEQSSLIIQNEFEADALEVIAASFELLLTFEVFSFTKQSQRCPSFVH